MRSEVGVTYPVVEIVSPPDDFADEYLDAFRLHVRGGQDFLDDVSLTPVLQRFLNAAALDAEATLWRAVLEQTRRRRWVGCIPPGVVELGEPFSAVRVVRTNADDSETTLTPQFTYTADGRVIDPYLGWGDSTGKEWRFDYDCGFEELPADLELGIFNVAMAMYERNENDMKKASLKMGRRYGLKRALVA